MDVDRRIRGPNCRAFSAPRINFRLGAFSLARLVRISQIDPAIFQSGSMWGYWGQDRLGFDRIPPMLVKAHHPFFLIRLGHSKESHLAAPIASAKYLLLARQIKMFTARFLPTSFRKSIQRRLSASESQETPSFSTSAYPYEMSAGPCHELEETERGFLPSLAFTHLLGDTVHRSKIVCRRMGACRIWLLAFIPRVSAGVNVTQFANATDPAVQDDVEVLIGMFSWRNWSATADAIRNGADRRQCLTNLSLALAAVGPLTQSETSGSSGALTLLPTAGALIGAPTKELWVVFKLMPIAGVLSMLLSLGGNIVPTEASDYELNSSTFSYGGMIATHTNDEEVEELEDYHSLSSGAQAFAAKVEARSRDVRGGTRYIRVWYGIILQCVWLGVLLATCWFTQSGSIIVWWCKVCRNVFVHWSPF